MKRFLLGIVVGFVGMLLYARHLFNTASPDTKQLVDVLVAARRAARRDRYVS